MTHFPGGPVSAGLAMVVTACLTACEPRSARQPLVGSEERQSASAVAAGATADSAFAAVPESVWVEVRGPTLVAFHPSKSNAELEADTGLAIALDDLAYHLGAAMDSLVAAGFRVQYSSGDTVWMRAGSLRSLFVRLPDSATVGYVYTDTTLRRTVIYGVRTYVDLVAYAHAFKRFGAAATAPTPPASPRRAPD